MGPQHPKKLRRGLDRGWLSCQWVDFRPVSPLDGADLGPVGAATPRSTPTTYGEAASPNFHSRNTQIHSLSPLPIRFNTVQASAADAGPSLTAVARLGPGCSALSAPAPRASAHSRHLPALPPEAAPARISTSPAKPAPSMYK